MSEIQECLKCQRVAEGGVYPFCVRKCQPHFRLGGRPTYRLLHSEGPFICTGCAKRRLRQQAWLFTWASVVGMVILSLGQRIPPHYFSPYLAILDVPAFALFVILRVAAVIGFIEGVRRFRRLWAGYHYVGQSPDLSVTQMAIDLRRKGLLKELGVADTREVELVPLAEIRENHSWESGNPSEFELASCRSQFIE